MKKTFLVVALLSMLAATQVPSLSFAETIDPRVQAQVNSTISEGDNFFENQDYTSALEAYKTAVHLDPTNLRALESMRKAGKAGNNLISVSLELAQITEKDPYNRNARKVQIEVYKDLAESARKMGFHSQANSFEAKAESLSRKLD